jgi:hypothetical protein
MSQGKREFLAGKEKDGREGKELKSDVDETFSH